MPDGDAVIVNQDLLDQQPEDLLALVDVEGFRGFAQTPEKAVQRIGQPQDDGFIGPPVPQGLQFAPQALLALAQVGHPATQFIERQQIFLIGGHQALHALENAGQVAGHLSLAPPRRAMGLGSVEAAVDLLSDQDGILQQAQHFGPNQAVQQVLADRPGVA